jgi:hypothetical protein
MTTVKEMADTVGISESNMKMFLDLYAIEVKVGSTLEEAIEKVHLLFFNLATQAELPESRQAEWFIALKRSIASDVWHTVRNREEQRKIFA